ncbi:MAG TPA: DUF4142 domain-containing protein [Polyangiaceae bacterium]|nr:DUF4142 domain-containing protein [Polyangiaceae bacterium]
MTFRSIRHVGWVALAVGAFACSNDHNNNNVTDASAGGTAATGGSGGTAGSGGATTGGSSGRGGSAGSSGGSTGISDAATGGSAGQGGAAGSAGTKADSGIVDAGLSDAGVTAFSAAEWIGLLDTVNGGEVSQGELAQTKASASDVKSFAAEMVADHTAGLEKDKSTATALGVTPEQTKVSANLKAQSDATISSLGTVSASAFDRAYMQAQVTQHAAVLSLLDVGILSMGGSPDASTPDGSAATPLLTLLEQTRAIVREHLNMANSIVSGLP